MQSLTPQTFAEAMTLCGENSHYKAGIIFDKREAMVEFISELREIGNIPSVRRAITRRTDYGRLEFFNGSVIEIIPGTEVNLRGRRYNQVIASGVFDRELRSRLEYMTVPYRTTASMAEQFVDAALFGMRSRQQTQWATTEADLPADTSDETSEELDAFLDSFSVNKSVNKTAL